MSALALLLHDRGLLVRGSDLTESDFTMALRQRGIPVHIGESEEIEEDAVVYTGAVTEGNPQLAAAKRAGKRLIPDRKSTRLNSSHCRISRMPSSA